MKYSIITCVYNACEYLQDYFTMIDSLDYLDFEVIIIDDCSNDDTEVFFRGINKKNYLVTYKRLSENKGPGNARNIGIDLATGDYIIFIDADDNVSSQLLSRLDQYKDTDIVFFDYSTFSSNGVLTEKTTITNPDKELLSIADSMKRTTGCVWGKRFKHSIIADNRIEFPLLYKSEDIVFLMRYLLKCCTYDYCRKSLYAYRISENSLMHRNIENQFEYAFSAIQLLRQEVDMPEDVFQVIYHKEIIYDLTNTYIAIGKSRKELNDFWSRENVDLTLLKEGNCFNSKQKVVLHMIKWKAYLGLKIVNSFR